jgi:ParB family chromosome partitioning protein
LQQAYEAKLLSGRKLIAARRLVDQRRRQGKGLRVIEDKTGESISIEGLLRTYRENADKKRSLVRKAEFTQGHLVFLTEGLRKLFADSRFSALLTAEGLDTLPRNLADRVQRTRRV